MELFIQITRIFFFHTYFKSKTVWIDGVLNLKSQSSVLFTHLPESGSIGINPPEHPTSKDR